MDREYGFAAYYLLVGLSFVLFRRWWVRDRTDFLRRAVRVATGERMRQRAENNARWYETHRVEAERRCAYLGFAFILVGTVVFLLRWSPVGITLPFSAASNPAMETDANRQPGSSPRR
jgi:hypothetical protein